MGAGFDNMPKDQRGLLASYFICVGGPCCPSWVGLLGVSRQLLSLQAALSELQEAAMAGLGRATSPHSREPELSSP